MSEETQAPAQEAPANEAPNLSVNDLGAVASVIDLAVQRGAFKAAEAKQVGEIYERVSNFVKFIQEQQAAAAEAQASEPAEAPANTTADAPAPNGDSNAA